MTEIVPLLVVAPILIWVALSDLRRLVIPNWASLSAIAIFLVVAPGLGWDEAAVRLAVSTGVFILGVGLWLVRLVGAGDVKLMAALLLLIPSTELPGFPVLFAAMTLISVIAITALRRARIPSLSNWRSMQEAHALPLGVAISLSGLAIGAEIARAGLFVG